MKHFARTISTLLFIAEEKTIRSQTQSLTWKSIIYDPYKEYHSFLPFFDFPKNSLFLKKFNLVILYKSGITL